MERCNREEARYEASMSAPQREISLRSPWSWLIIRKFTTSHRQSVDALDEGLRFVFPAPLAAGSDAALQLASVRVRV